MTLSAALTSATSSLRAIQLRLALGSSNIANADNPNYTAKRANLAPSVAGGVGTGVDVTGIGSGVDANLIRCIGAATSDNGAAQAFYKVMKALSDTLGHVSSDGNGTAAASKLSILQSRLDKLAATPESVTLKGEAVSALDDAVAALRSNSEEIQRKRAETDAALLQAVGTANDALRDIHTLNDSIARAKATSRPTGDLEDLRNQALRSLSQELNVNSYIAANGTMVVHSGSGEILVGTEVHELTFAAAAKMTPGTVYPSDLSGVRVNGNDVSGSISTGRISALLALRDTALPKVQANLDAAATKLKDSLNAAANAGSAVPPPNALVGTTVHAATDPLSATGTLRVALTDSAGKVVDCRDLNLASYATVADLVGALNTIPGISAALDAEHHLAVRATSANCGIAIAGGSVGGKSFSGAFGLNDLITGSGAADIAVKPQLLADSRRLPTGSVSVAGTLVPGSQAVGPGSAKVVTAITDALRTSNVTADMSNLIAEVGANTNSAKGRAAATETGLNALTSRFSSQYGVNVDEENARIAQLQSAYASSALILSAVKAMFNDLLAAVR